MTTKRVPVTRALRGVLGEIFTPECTDDTDDPSQLGRTMIFGYALSPNETEALAAELLAHAHTARCAQVTR